MIPSNYEPLGLAVHRWTDVEALLRAASIVDGVHVVSLPGGRILEVLVLGMDLLQPEDHSVPVFFSGALGDRAGTSPPYFSGVGLTRDLGVPLIALSDPLMSSDGEVRLGWYTGALGEGLQDSIVSLLQGLADQLGRELLLLGGSGGAFAALYFADRLGSKASACVWNPQSDLLGYEKGTVGRYLSAVGVPDAHQFDGSVAARAATSVILADGGLDHALPPRMGHRRSLVLQNASDWHVKAHLAPLVQADDFTFTGDGAFENSAGHCVLLAEYGTGHAVPSVDILTLLLKGMSQVRLSGREVADMLFGQGLIDLQKQAGMPRDLRLEADQIAGETVLMVEESPDHRDVWVGGLPEDRGPMTCRFTESGPEGRRLLADGLETRVAVGSGAAAVDLGVFDGFGNQLFQKRVQL